MYAEVQSFVHALLCDLAMVRQGTHIDLDQALGDNGLGLGSLALVRTVTALENQFGVTLSDDVWADAGRFTGHQLAGAVVSALAAEGS